MCYLPILLFGFFSFGLGLALVLLSRLRARRWTSREKRTAEPYECGIDSAEQGRFRFDIRFYLISLLFIVFDLEIALLFPWALSLQRIGSFGFWSMMLFLAILTIGFVYEWRKGALDWE